LAFAQLQGWVIESSYGDRQMIKSSLKVKVYSDGANLDAMLEMSRNPAIGGLTTNPTLMKKAGLTDYRAFAKEVLAGIKDKPISFEVFSDDLVDMKRQALELASWGPNVYVKIPVTNSEGVSTAPLIRELAAAGVKLNVTAILTLEQVLTVCEALDPKVPAVVSVFAGRIADTGRDPMPLMAAALQICRSRGPSIELLWASCREVYNVVQADQVGCDIITVAPEMIAKLSMFGKDLAALSLDTVRMFKKDAEAAGFKL